MINIRRGEIYLVDLGIQKGSIQAGKRPVVVISNNMNNKYSPTINVLPITSRKKNNIPVHVNISHKEGLLQPSTILTEQIVTINKSQIIKYLGECNKYKMYEIEKALLIQNGVDLNIHLEALVI
jgi:mRNA interferase MazF